MPLHPRTLPPRLRRVAGVAALALVAAAATLAPTSAGSAQAASPRTNPCSYLTDAAASAVLGGGVQHARVSNDLCVYHAPGRRGSLAFINVVMGKAATSARFATFRRLAGNRSQAIAGVGDAAYTIGPNVVALRGDTLIVASVGETGASPSALRTASIELARSAANSQLVVAPAAQGHKQ